MLKKLIVIEGDNQTQFENEKELVKKLVSTDYYELPEDKKKEILEMKALGNTLSNKMQILNKDEIEQKTNIDGKFVLLDEKTYILSLLLTNNITLLERLDSDIYIKYLDKSKFTKNYVIVNNFAQEILNKYVAENVKNG